MKDIKAKLKAGLGPLLISLVITGAFLWLYHLKEQARKEVELTGEARFKFLEFLELKAYDFRFQLSHQLWPPTPSDRVLIVAIDDRAIGELGWPFPRAEWAKFLRRMKEYEAQTVALDVVFADEGNPRELEFIRTALDQFERFGLDQPPERVPARVERFLSELKRFREFIEQSAEAADHDAILAREVSSMCNLVLGWYFYTARAEAGKPEQAFQAEADLMQFASITYQLPPEMSMAELVLRSGLARAYGLAPNLEAISEAGTYFGFFNSTPDTYYDGVLRNTPIIALFTLDPFVPAPENTFIYPSLSLTAAWLKRERVPWIKSTPDGLELDLDGQTVLIDRNGIISGDTLGLVRPDSFGCEFRVRRGGEEFIIDPAGRVVKDNERSPRVEALPEGFVVHLGDRHIPTDQFGRVLVNWMGPRGTYPYYSIYDVLDGFEEVNHRRVNRGLEPIEPRKIFKDKIVMVGSTSIGAHDLRSTPFGNAPGVEMHANVVSNILNGDFLLRKEAFARYDMLFILGIGIAFGLLLPRFSSITGGLVALLVFAGYLGLNFYLFSFKHLSFNLVLPLSEVLVCYLGITVYRYATEEREKRFIRGAFSQYLSPKVIDQLVADPSRLNLGGEDKEITAFFSDIQSFSSFSEKMTTQQLVHFLNIYLTEMCDIILSYEGTIDKFEGDAIIAFFGAPVDNPDHARLAVLCAAEIQAKMTGFREQWIKEGWPEVHMRIGLNSGIMSVGNMGSRDRMDYTIMGDNVNLAARLESAGKQYQIYTMISEETRVQAGEAAEYRELDAIRVKGRQQPVKIFELLGKKGEVDPKRLEAARTFEKGLKLYRQRYWLPAVEQFKKALEIFPGDGPSQVFIARCEEYSDNPPGSGWDGVYTMTTK